MFVSLNNLLLFIFGIVFGSFISAYTFRYLKNLSIVRGRSFCPKCKKTIKWYDNIPLLSFVVLSGKCRNCNQPISFRYPLIELVSGLGFIFVGYNLIWLSIFCILISILVIDFEGKIIPDELVFLGILFSIYDIRYTIYDSLLAGFLCASLLLLLHIVTKGRGMGLGDVKFAVLGGIIVGLKLDLIWLFMAFLTGGLVGIILILLKSAKLKDQIAFGPFLVVSIGLTLLFGEKILYEFFYFH